MNHPLLDIQNLTVEFNTEDSTVCAIDSISFSIEAGKTVALVGESGSGKSVSALSILKLIPSPPSIIKSGKILFTTKQHKQIDLVTIDNESLQHIRGNEIGIIFQEPMTSLNPLMKCGKQVAESIMKHKQCTYEIAREKTIKLFEDVKLPNPSEIMERYPHELSGGQKQRVMIAMAICCEPNLLIADEPTTALDVTVQKVILDLLKELQQKYGMAILFITHDLNLVKNFADKVAVLYKSKLVEQNIANELFSNPTHPYTKGLLACRPDPTKRVHLLKTVSEILNETESTIHSKNEVDGNQIDSIHFRNRIIEIQQSIPILQFEHLNVWYPTKHNFLGKVTAWYKAVNNVNLLIHQGETMGLVGESGCGKTTIGKAIVKLTPISSGAILYKGKDIALFNKSDLAEYRKKVQIIFQDPYSSLNPRVSIGNAIKEPMDVHGLHSSYERKEKAIELLTKVDLKPEHYNRYPHEFSGGQRQRICIARALALQPEFIICDESVSALDVSVQAQVLNLLVHLREEFNLSYLFISHDLGVIKHISDHIAVMNKGNIVELNNSEELYKNPQEDYTKKLISSSFDF